MSISRRLRYMAPERHTLLAIPAVNPKETNNQMKKLALVLTILTGLVAGTLPALAQTAGGNTGYGNAAFAADSAGRVIASEYGKYALTTLSPITGGVSSTVQFSPCFIKVGTSNRNFFPFGTSTAQNLNVPLEVLDGSTLSESISSETASSFPSAAPVSYPQPQICSFTATFTNSHLAGVTITSNDSGLQEAMNDAVAQSIGVVTLDSSFTGTVVGAAVNPLVQIEDLRSSQVKYWNPSPGLTVMAAPIALVAQAACDATHYFCSDATAVGSASWGSTMYGCVSYVDIYGNEGPCSPTSTVFTSVASKQIDVGFSGGAGPAASAGAVGYEVYLSLSGGTYALAYKMPLTSANCVLTTLENVIPACKVTNATYGQTGVNAVFGGTQYPVVTSQNWVGVGGTSSTSDYVGNSNARTTYAYAPSSHPQLNGIVASSQAFGGATAPATTVPAVLGTLQLPQSGLMNYVGATLRICGDVTEASAGSTATISSIQLYWDAQGSNVTAGEPILLGGPEATFTMVTSNADVMTFCQDLVTTTASTSVTGGAIQATTGWMIEGYGVVGAHTYSAFNYVAATTASLNLTQDSRIQVVYVHTTGTDGATPILNNLTAQIIN